MKVGLRSELDVLEVWRSFYGDLSVIYSLKLRSGSFWIIILGVWMITWERFCEVLWSFKLFWRVCALLSWKSELFSSSFVMSAALIIVKADFCCPSLSLLFFTKLVGLLGQTWSSTLLMLFTAQTFRPNRGLSILSSFSSESSYILASVFPRISDLVRYLIASCVLTPDYFRKSGLLGASAPVWPYLFYT